MSYKLKLFLTASFLLASGLLLIGCGQRGPLTLPDTANSATP